MIGKNRDMASAEIAETKKLAARELITKAELVDFFNILINSSLFLGGDDEREISFAADLLALQQHKSSPLRQHSHYFFGVYDGNVMVGVGQLVISENKKSGVKNGLLCNLEVRPTYRGQGMASELTKTRIECARQNGCDYVRTEVDTDNPIGLVTKFKDGFVLDDMDHSFFKLTKQINLEEDTDKINPQSTDLEQVPLNNLKLIEDLICQKWVGVGIRNLGDSKDNDPHNWTLLMKRRTYEK